MTLRAVIALLLTVGTAACAQKQMLTGDGTSPADQPPTADTGPKYVTESQRARAHYYWLPQNQLPADAGVEFPEHEGAAAKGGG